MYLAKLDLNKKGQELKKKQSVQLKQHHFCTFLDYERIIGFSNKISQGLFCQEQKYQLNFQNKIIQLIYTLFNSQKVKIVKNPHDQTYFIIGQNIDYGDLKVHIIMYLKIDILTQTISMKCFNVLVFDLTSFSVLYST